MTGAVKFGMKTGIAMTVGAPSVVNSLNGEAIYALQILEAQLCARFWHWLSRGGPGQPIAEQISGGTWI
jgi:hypothetical protein